jgi:hypothetical protein
MHRVKLITYDSNIGDINILQNWSITQINTDQITIKNNKLRKKVTFADNIELYQSSTHTTKKDKMSKYGNEPTAIEKFIEEYLYKLTILDNLHFTKFKLIASLKVLKLYYPLMYNLINTHYLLSNNNYKYIYTKHTFIRPHSLFKITEFIEKYTDIVEKQLILYKFYKKYCGKD